MEHVIPVDESGAPVGSADEHHVHGRDTPPHLALSRHVLDSRGRFPCTRRATGERTWPGVRTNSCRGLLRPGETMSEAMPRRWGMVAPLPPHPHDWPLLGLDEPPRRWRAPLGPPAAVPTATRGA